MHECFQYTKYVQVAKRLKCVKVIPPGQLQHEGRHAHSLDSNAIHYCRERCASCQYYCILRLGHSQKEHETHHGSMLNVRWSVDGPDEEGLEVDGRRFSTNDEGAPMMCNLVCKALDRHVHIDYCRAKTSDECRANHEIQHIPRTLNPEPDRPKDFLTHNLFWKRSGFRDPYSREEQANFAKCDSMCAGSEHVASGGKPAAPSYCTLPLFHAPSDANSVPPKQGYISGDGHQFECKNPVARQQAFHIIFMVDRSLLMSKNDIKPPPASAVSGKISANGMHNRLGAVYAALHHFWIARQAISGSQRDANTVILYSENAQPVCVRDTQRSPDQLLDLLLPHNPRGSNNFGVALQTVFAGILEKWCEDTRPLVVVFLSGSDVSASGAIVQQLFRTTAEKLTGLSFHGILFGPKMISTLTNRIITVARDAQNKIPALMWAQSSFHEAFDSIQLSQTLLGIAESLRKPSGSSPRQLIHRDPMTRQAFHIIFLIDRSKSMIKDDTKPLESSPVRGKIVARGMNNRLGAVYAALHHFWTARQATLDSERDAYTIILHAQKTQNVCENDMRRSPDALLGLLLPNAPHGGNSFDLALKAADAAISKGWNDMRPPVVIFLSDGIASVSDAVVRKMFRTAALKGSGLSFQAILFGPKNTSARMEQMVTVARNAQSKIPGLTSAPSSFHEALDSVQLSQTFHAIAESLRKPRGALMQ